jgi:O-glycosyl hydrolase
MPSVVRLRNSYHQPLEPHYSFKQLMEYDREIVNGARTRLPGNLMPKLMLTSWTAPAEMKQNNNHRGGDSRNVLKKYADGKFIYKAFAEDYWLASLYAYSELGINPRWIRCVSWSLREAEKFLQHPRRHELYILT